MPPIQRLHRRFLRCLGWLGHQLAQGARWERAAEIYERGLEVDEAAEPLYRSLMACHLRLGLRAEALRTYARCREALSRPPREPMTPRCPGLGSAKPGDRSFGVGYM